MIKKGFFIKNGFPVELQSKITEVCKKYSSDAILQCTVLAVPPADLSDESNYEFHLKTTDSICAFEIDLKEETQWKESTINKKGEFFFKFSGKDEQELFDELKPQLDKINGNVIQCDYEERKKFMNHIMLKYFGTDIN